MRGKNVLYQKTKIRNQPLINVDYVRPSDQRFKIVQTGFCKKENGNNEFIGNTKILRTHLSTPEGRGIGLKQAKDINDTLKETGSYTYLIKGKEKAENFYQDLKNANAEVALEKEKVQKEEIVYVSRLEQDGYRIRAMRALQKEYGYSVKEARNLPSNTVLQTTNYDSEAKEVVNKLSSEGLIVQRRVKEN